LSLSYQDWQKCQELIVTKLGSLHSAPSWAQFLISSGHRSIPATKFRSSKAIEWTGHVQGDTTREYYARIGFSAGVSFGRECNSLGLQ
jgi:hypothetical protein